jgi:hypothetical protein
MKTFIYKIIILIVIICGIDYLVGFVFSNLYKKAKSGIAYKENYIFKETNQDLLIFGSSRAEYHYIPAIISDETGMTTYNVGREGAGIYFHYAVLLATLERYKPKVVVLDLDYRDFYFRSSSFGPDILKEVAPFYGKISKEFDSFLIRENYDKLLYQSNLYKYNKKFFNIISGNIRNEKKYNGYTPLDGFLLEIPESREEEFIVGDDLLKVTKDFIEKAKKNNIKVILVLSPSYKELPSEFYKYANSLHSRFKINVINHFKDTTFLNHPKYFHDADHLNNSGADLYSKQVAKEINAIIEIDKLP